MRIKILFLLIVIASTCKAQTERSSDHEIKNLVDYVNPLIGTTGRSGTEYGGMIPSITEPFGMTQWSAMTRVNGVSRACYHHNDKKVIGFIGTHQPAIWMGDYGFMSLMPQIDEVKLKVSERGLKYSHDEEVTTPYYYSTILHDKKSKIKAEITATKRCGFFKFSFPENHKSFISIEMSRLLTYKGYVKIIPEKRQIVGYNPDRHNNVWGTKMGPELENFNGYFVLQFDTEFADFGTYSDSTNTYSTSDSSDLKIFNNKKEIAGGKIGAFISFKNISNKEVKVKVASSFISIDQAKENLKKEINHWDFAQIVEDCKNNWEKQLERIEVEGGTKDQKVVFYSSMYHSLLYPRIFSEYGKYYSAFDDRIHEGTSYNDYSLWDTFRALHPLLTIIAPEHVNPMITSLLQMYDEGGWIPKWPNLTYSNIMIGTHSDAIIADAYVKGFRDFDVPKAYEAMYKNAMVAPEGDENKKWKDRAEWTSYEARGGISGYKEMGYVPADKTAESVSRTLEFAYGDFCVAQLANGLGKNDDYKYFLNRSENYKNVYNSETGFMQPRLSDGTFYTGNPRKYRAFTEGSPWTYLFCAMQNIDGLINTMGGKEIFTQKLDENFDYGHYRHSNEPGHHYIYLYNYADQYWKTQDKVTEVLSEKYKNKPDGLCGNDDCGQMSAWYVFSAMGFYPVTPGSGEYALGKPMFDEITMCLLNPRNKKKKTFTIRKINSSHQNKYIKSVRLDGKLLEKPFIKHLDLLKGQELVFEMDSIPHK